MSSFGQIEVATQADIKRLTKMIELQATMIEQQAKQIEKLTAIVRVTNNKLCMDCGQAKYMTCKVCEFYMCDDCEGYGRCNECHKQH